MQNTILLDGNAIHVEKKVKGSMFIIEHEQSRGIVTFEVLFSGDYTPKENEYVLVVGRLLKLGNKIVITANSVTPKNPNINDVLKGKFEIKSTKNPQ